MVPPWLAPRDRTALLSCNDLIFSELWGSNMAILITGPNDALWMTFFRATLPRIPILAFGEVLLSQLSRVLCGCAPRGWGIDPEVPASAPEDRAPTKEVELDCQRSLNAWRN